MKLEPTGEGAWRTLMVGVQVDRAPCGKDSLKEISAVEFYETLQTS